MKKEKEGMMQWIAADKDSCCGDFKPDNMKSNHNANDETKGESPHFVPLYTVFILFYPCLMIMITFHYTKISLN